MKTMKSIGKAAAFLLRKAAALRGRARLLFLASFPRRRAAVVAGISRQLRTLLSRGPQQADHADDVVQDDYDNEHAAPTPGMAELATLFFREVDGGDGGGCQLQYDWTLALRSLFGDEEDEIHGRGEDEQRAGDVDAARGVEEEEDDDDPPSVMEVIRRRREREGREFRIEDEIDRAADMFIARVWCRRLVN